MSEAGASEMGQLQNYTVDQLAGAIALTLGAVGSLLLVVWRSRCHCRMNLCYILQCERTPPENEPELEDDDEETGGGETLVPKPVAKGQKTADPVPDSQPEPEPEPEPQPEMLP